MRRTDTGQRELSDPRVTPALTREQLAGSFPGDLGIEVTEVADDRVAGRLVVDARHLNPFGAVHAGVWTALPDTLAGYATLRRLPAGWTFTPAELKLNLFAAAGAGDVLDAVAQPLHVGRLTQVWEVRVSRAGRLAANFVCTQVVRPPR